MGIVQLWKFHRKIQAYLNYLVMGNSTTVKISLWDPSLFEVFGHGEYHNSENFTLGSKFIQII